MATKKRPSDRHKPSRMVRIPERLAQLLEEVADQQLNSLTEQVKIAVREYLERIDKWPPPPTKSKPKT